MTAVNQWKSWIRRLGHPEKPRAERRIPSGFIAWQTNNPASKPSAIKNISSAGLYLLTEERWPVDELIPLTIALEGLPENSADDRIPVQARVARHGEDGIGLLFVLPDGLDRALWEVLVRNAVLLTDPKDLSYTLRLLRTTLFLYRLCHQEAHEALQLFSGELDEPRTRIAMQIVFGAEKLLASEPGADKMRAHPQIVAGILKYGSWAHDDLTRQLWIGLLATSCHVDAIDESSHAFVDLLVNVTPTQGLILVTACKKVMERRPETGDLPSARVIYTPEEMIRLTGIYDPTRIAVEISYLFNAGLIERVFDFTSYVSTESFDITPSRLGLELYERCKAHRIQPHSLLDESESAQPSL
ncbi:MAG: hypothetical protein ABR860_01495 [Terracidiphilus sp.]|jgi:hypothetical protein